MAPDGRVLCNETGRGGFPAPWLCPDSHRPHLQAVCGHPDAPRGEERQCTWRSPEEVTFVFILTSDRQTIAEI